MGMKSDLKYEVAEAIMIAMKQEAVTPFHYDLAEAAIAAVKNYNFRQVRRNNWDTRDYGPEEFT